MANVSKTRIVPKLPYRGIESFRFCDKDIFFARDQETQELLRFVTMYRGVLLYGDSGSGKSSLINAGFLPTALEHKFIPHRLRVQPRDGEEIVLERIPTSPDGGAPYLNSIFDDDDSEPRRVLSVTTFKTKLARFRVNDLEERIALKLRDSKDPLSLFIRDGLSKETRDLLFQQKKSSTVLAEKARAALVADLDTLLKTKPLYNKTRFSKITLPPEILGLLTTGKNEETISLNRLLLEHAYPDNGPPREQLPLLIFDQFEEFVTLFEIAPRGDALKEAQVAQKTILDTLVELLRDTSYTIKLVFVFREDYLAKLTKLFVQRPELTDQYLRLTPIRVEKLNDIIISPFKKFPGTFKPEFSTSLVDDLRTAFETRSELGSVNLSEVQTACLRLWQSSDPQNLFRQKGIQGLLEEYLLDAVRKFPEELRDPSVALLTRLVTDSGTRNVVSRDDLINRLHEEESIPVDLLEQSLDKLETDTKLVRRERRYETFFYEIVSEFLVEWIRKQRVERRVIYERRRLRSQLESSRFEDKAREESTRTSFNEREFVAKVEASAPEEFAYTLLRPSLEEETALRRAFGDERYQQLHSLALRRHIMRSNRPPSGNVVLIPGLGGTSLSVNDGGSDEPLWMNAFGIMRWGLEALRLTDDGRASFDPKLSIRPTGVQKRSYGELVLTLLHDWNVKTFYFDWRKDLNLAADELNLQIGIWFGAHQPIHIVAHSTGGLVAQTFIKRYPERWKAFWDREGHGRAGGRLVMLGTPLHGSFTVLQMITGLEGMVRKLALLDEHESLKILKTLHSFPGLYQALPSPLQMPAIRKLYNSGTYGKFNLDIPQQHLDNSRAQHQALRRVLDPDRMIYIAGYNQPTPCDVADWNKLDNNRGYRITLDGDGVVPHKLGPGFPNLRTYWIEENHGRLPTNKRVLKALSSVLRTGTTDILDSQLPPGRISSRSQDHMRHQCDTAEINDEGQLTVALRGLGVSPAGAANAHRLGTPAPTSIATEERKVEELVTNRILDYRFDEQITDEIVTDLEWTEYVAIEIGLVYGGIEDVTDASLKTHAGPIDAIAVGHYMGVAPARSELSLDLAISGALKNSSSSNSLLSKSELLITRYTNSGLIQGMLGQLFFIQDPRKSGRQSKPTNRVVIVAGLGEVGRLGVPELTLLARSLVWAVATQNRRHLATVLIGSGEGNLSQRDAISAWLTGIRAALNDLPKDKRLLRITFVEYNPRKVLQLNQILARESRQRGSNLGIMYQELSAATLKRLEQHAEIWARQESRAQSREIEYARNFPARVSLKLNPTTNTYSFSAMTATSIVPEQEASIDPQLLWTANNELVGQRSVAMQLERSQFLQQVLLSKDVIKHLSGSEPLVLMLDPAMARIHWELVTQPSMSRTPRASSFWETQDAFLGTARGLTRQLPAMVVPQLGRFVGQKNVLRILIVADPASDTQLPGAEAEGAMIADLFNSFTFTTYSARIEVKCLFGSIEATRTNVLRELMLRPYDVLHFVGYCVLEMEGDPNLSGWVFNQKRKELLGSNELRRVNNVPRFVFSNACELGLTPNRAAERNDRLAPTLAETFFACGVQNFICPAWPIDNGTARDFALMLYSGLLGSPSDTQTYPMSPLPMSEAMRLARSQVAGTPNGGTAWGAYQHYGNPDFQLLYELEPKPSKSMSKASTKRRAPKKASKKATPRKRSIKR